MGPVNKYDNRRGRGCNSEYSEKEYFKTDLQYNA